MSHNAPTSPPRHAAPRHSSRWCISPLPVLIAALALIVAACANIGSPEGGPRDYTAPRVTRTSPQQGAVNVKGNKVEIVFDEIVNIKDQQKKVAVSPVQHSMPMIRSLGKKVTVEFRDTMLPDATYVIDFANSIEDNHEGNPIENFAYTFATGPVIDTLCMSGMVMRASDLEPMQYVLVGVYSNLSDTAFTTLPMERIARTDDRGRFTIRGLKPGRYRIYALNDVDGDYHMARTEDMAFIEQTFEPTTTTFTSSDTTFTFDHRVDTVVEAVHTRYLPDDVLLWMFNENYRQLYLQRWSRPSASKLVVQFGATPDTLPELRVLDPAPQSEPWYCLERNARSDSLVYWLTDSALIKADTLAVAMRYQHLDSTKQIMWQTDTLRFGYRKPRSQVKQEENDAKERERFAEQLARLQERQHDGKEVDEGDIRDLERKLRVPVPRIKIEMLKRGTLDVTDSLKLRFDAPISHIDPNGVHLEMKHDSLWDALPAIPALRRVSDHDPFTYYLPMTFQPDSSYRVRVDSLAITSVYGLHNDSLVVEFKVRSLEEYANVTLHVDVADSAFVELLDSRGGMVRTAPVVGGVAKIPNVLPGTYYARLVLDTNGNGKWDTGSFIDHREPELVLYYPKAMKLRRNWDVDQQWNIFETPIDQQKPEALLKNKPEKRKNALDPDKDKKKNTDEDEEDDEFNSQGFVRGTYSGDKYRDYRNNNR